MVTKADQLLDATLRMRAQMLGVKVANLRLAIALTDPTRLVELVAVDGALACRIGGA